MSLAELITVTVGAFFSRTTLESSRHMGAPDVTHAPPDTRRVIRNRQYCQLLSSRVKIPFDEISLACARSTMEHEMALVPGGHVHLVHAIGSNVHGDLELVAQSGEPITIDPFYLDRDCVTNADFAKFVTTGGYNNPRYWPEAILANVLQFVDRSGQPGPKEWSQGRPARELLDHPVTGICWYEANAYATWAGKRLPSTEEWQRAGTWPKSSGSSSSELRYPWGNAFDPLKANTWSCGLGRTSPVDAFSEGNAPNGVRQLIGNVWEWVDAQFQPAAQEGISVSLDDTMAEVRGGAFDTYFHSQATCQFRTGHPLLFRGSNVGFRCCISESEISESGTTTVEDHYQDEP